MVTASSIEYTVSADSMISPGISLNTIFLLPGRGLFGSDYQVFLPIITLLPIVSRLNLLKIFRDMPQ